MIIRELTPNDVLQHEYVASQAFIYPFSEKEPLELPKGKMLGAFFDDNKTMLSDLQCEDFFGWFYGKKISCAAVSGVASKPEYRRQGSIRQIFDYLFERAEQWGYAYSVLYPFSEVFYGKMGYVNAGYYIRLEMPFSQLSVVPRNFDVLLYNGTQKELLYDVYNRAAKEHCLGFYRDSDRYFSAAPYAINEYTYIWLKNGREAQAYITFTVDRKESCVTVSEISFLNAEALYGILGFMRTFDGNIQTLIFEKIPMDSPILQIIPEPEKTKRTIGNIGSVRVLDVKKILQETVFPAGTAPFSLCCDDGIARNNGVFYIEPGTENKISFFPEKKEYDIRLDPRALSRVLLCGLPQNESALPYINGLEIRSGKSEFLRAFPPRSVFFTDGF